jgi:hypothetical protein
MGSILDMVAVSHGVVVRMMCKELGRCVNMGLLCLVRDHCFASVVTPRGYKSRRSPSRTPTSSRMNSHCLLASFLRLKREREAREISGA